MCGEVGRHLIEGISDGFVPGIFARHRHTIDEIVAVDSGAAIGEMRRLAREFGLLSVPAPARTCALPASYGRDNQACGTSSRSSVTRERSTSTITSSAPEHRQTRLDKTGTGGSCCC
jgi:hypothetical protein